MRPPIPPLPEPPAPEPSAAAHGRVAMRVGGARLPVLEHRAAYGEASPVRLHRDGDEVFHIVEGTLRFVVGGVARTACAGETVLTPRGVPHGFRVVSPGGARYLTARR